MYKSPINVGDIRKKSSNETTVPNEAALEPLSWRNAYKKRCLEESKKSRQKLLHKFRNIQVRYVSKNHVNLLYQSRIFKNKLSILSILHEHCYRLVYKIIIYYILYILYHMTFTRTLQGN